VPTNSMKLLIVENEGRMADLLRKGPSEEGHMATCNVRRRRGLSPGTPRNSMSPEKVPIWIVNAQMGPGPTLHTCKIFP
jgi:hypothetical protein